MSLKEEKKALRKEIKRHIRVYSKEELKAHSISALHQLELDADFKRAKSVLLFWSLNDEVQTHEFIEKWSKNKIILLPKVIGSKIYPNKYENKVSMVLGKFNIAEPSSNLYEGDIDLVVVPGLAFDKNGHRLGRGKGYYDRFLKKFHGVKIGLCFNFQYTDYIPFEAFDMPMDKVIAG